MATARKEMTDLMREHTQEMSKVESQKRQLANQYKTEDKVPVMVSPLYQPYFGKVMDVNINGISIFLPIDGTTHLIPRTFADEVFERIFKVDDIIKKQRRMADIKENLESSPGELQLF